MGNRNRLILGLLAGAALTAALTACGSDDKKDEAAATTAPQATTAAVAATTAASSAPAAAATAAATQAAAARQAVTVKAGDFFFDQSTLSVKSGTVVVTLENTSDGNRPHTFIVKGKDGSDIAKSERIAPGQTGTLEFRVAEPGTYEYYCNLPGHADRGQKGTLTVS